MKVKAALNLNRMNDFINGISSMKESGVSLCKPIHYFDLAANKALIMTALDAINIKQREVPKKYNEYIGKLQEIQTEFQSEQKVPAQDSTKGSDQQRVRPYFPKDPKGYLAAVRKLKEEYAEAIEEYDVYAEELEALYKETKEIEFFGIPKSAFKIAEDNPKAVDALFGLMPCIIDG